MPTTNEDRPFGIPWDGPPEPCILRYETHNREADAWEPLTTLDVLDRFYVDSVRVLVAEGTSREWMSLAKFLENGGTLPDGPPKPIDYRERVNPPNPCGHAVVKPQGVGHCQAITFNNRPQSLRPYIPDIGKGLPASTTINAH